MANLDQILYEASLWSGKGCIRFWDRLDQNSGFHGNRKRPLTYNGENDVFTFSLLFFVRFFFRLAGNEVTRRGIKSRTSSNFDQIGPLPTELLQVQYRVHQFIVCTDTNNFSFILSQINHIKANENTFILLVFSASKELSPVNLPTEDPPVISWSIQHHKQLCHWSVKTSYIRSSVTSCQI